MEVDEQDSLSSKALGIFEDISGYDPKDSPSNGFEYLYQVICENSRIPKTTVATLDPSIYKKNQTVYVKECELVSVSQDLIPTQEWQRKQIQNFSGLRKDISELKKRWHKKKPLSEPVLPNDPENENSWLDFCCGSEPLLQTLFSIQQSGLDNLINYFSLWLEEGMIDFSHRTTIWLFSIFACLEEPLIPSTCANLRNIIRSAKEKRATLKNADDDLLIHLNLIICLAARYYKQIDLCD